MKIRRIGGRSGETIVEVMVSAVIFLMLVAVLQGAIMFCNSALKKSQQIRQDTAEICKKLQKASAEGTSVVEKGSEDFKFYAVSANGTTIGDQVFSIPIRKQEKIVEYDSTSGAKSKVSFYLFGTGAAGG